MKYLIDTHILIWLAVSPEKISKKIFEIIENPENNIFVSTVSFWEIAIKISVGKLDLQGVSIDDLIKMCNEQGVSIIELPVSAVKEYKKLAIKQNHKDPFDRILISICISDNYIFLSEDTKLKQYNSDGLNFIS